MAQREQALQEQAMQYAKMDPFQRATAGIYAGANKLGGAIGGMLGGQDPMLAAVSKRQELLKQEQPTDAAGWQSLASKLWQSGDTQGAQEALARSQTLQAAKAKLALEGAQTESALATAAGKKFEVSPEGRGQELAKTGKFTSESIANFVAGKGQLEAVDKFTKPQADFIAKAVELGYGDKPNYGGYTQEQTAKVNASLFKEDLTKKRAQATVFSPEIKMANQELDWRKQFLTENKPVVDQGANVRQSLALLNTDTPFAQAAFNNTVVSAFGGDKQKSNAEIKRLVNTGALDTRIANTITNFFEGKTTATTAQDQRNVLNAVDKALAARYDSSSEGWKTRLNQAKVNPSMVVPSYDEVVGTKATGEETANYKGATVRILERKPDGTIIIDNNGMRTELKPKKQ
jgi:hypothetical protein